MTDFELKSSRIIFQLEDMTKKEQAFWINHLNRIGLPIEDPREIFLPFTGEKANYLNAYIGTDHLQIRYWQWTDLDGQIHPIIDLSAYFSGGGDEEGVIILDGVAILINNATDLEWIGEVNHEFEPRLESFETIRSNLFEKYEEDEHDEVDDFFMSPAGQNAIRIDKEADAKYSAAIDAIREEHQRLREQFKSEFNLIKIVPTPIPELPTIDCLLAGYCKQNLVQEVADRIGYKFSKSRGDQRIVFVQWLNHQLVTTYEDYDTNTFLLTPEGKIDFQVYTLTYLADNNQEIMLELAPRIHSYFDLVNPFL